MSALSDYVFLHVKRGACQCGKCFDAPDKPAEHQPTGHTADLVFFKVCAVAEPQAEELRRLIQAHHGEYGPVDPLDGKEHNYMELGGYIGDQGVALMLMGLGTLLGLWKLLSPAMLGIDGQEAMNMAQMGLLSIQAPV
jgi:hypothetical protein